MQAGSSEDGSDFAARYAEAVFTAQQTLADAQAFYADLKSRAERLGRDPDHVKILPGIVPVIGATEAEARALEEELTELQSSTTAWLSSRTCSAARPVRRTRWTGRCPADLPTEDEINGNKSRYTLVVELARRERLTVRQLIARLGGGRGHRIFAGTPEQVADAIETWFSAGRRRRLQHHAAVLPSGLDLFVDHVVPILQRARPVPHRVQPAAPCATTTAFRAPPTGTPPAPRP